MLYCARYIHGLRVVYRTVHPKQGMISDWGTTMTVMDFGIHNRGSRIKGYQSNSVQEGRMSTIVPCCLNPGKVFEERVSSALPYAEYRRSVDTNYCGFMLDEHRVIGLKVGSR